MDHAGLGKSKRPDNRDYSLEKLANDLDAVLFDYDALYDLCGYTDPAAAGLHQFAIYSRPTSDYRTWCIRYV